MRRATVDDVEEMVQLRLAMQREFAHSGQAVRGVSDPETFVEVNRSYFERKLPAEEFVGFVAESDGRHVATSGMVVHEAPPTANNPVGVQGYVINMYTVPEYRGRGLARALLDALIAYAKGLKARRLWLRTSELGRSLYRSAGFAEDNDYMRLSIEASE